jgi:hypothetical protein
MYRAYAKKSPKKMPKAAREARFSAFPNEEAMVFDESFRGAKIAIRCIFLSEALKCF